MQELENLFKKIDNYQLTEREIYSGRLWGLFIFHFNKFKDEILDLFFPYMNLTSFQHTIFNTFIKQKKSELKSYLDDIENQTFNKPRIDSLNNQIKNISNFQDIVTFFKKQMKDYSWYQDEFMKKNTSIDIFYKYYPILKCLEIMYCDFKIKESRMKILSFSANSTLKEMYQQIDIDLMQDKNFQKYNLKTLEPTVMNICCNKDNQKLIDKRIVEKFGKHFSILYNHRLLLSCLNHLFFHENMIGELSFRVDSIIDKALWILDEFDFGSKLKVDICTLPQVSRFYDLENPKDNLWIFHDKQKNQISFEELCDDFELFNDDVVTQLVHLEYAIIDNEYYITHIDHEYIIYTFDEYENRLSDNSQKGYKKVKTFKVDNAQIPFFYQYTHFQNCYETRTRKEQKDYFLFIVLDSFFKHKELIKEYFEDISNQ